MSTPNETPMSGPVRRHEDGRPICTSSRPVNPWDGTPAVHPDAVDVGGCSEGCCDDYRCPHCGVRWRVGYDG